MKRFVQILENVGLLTIPLFLATAILSNAQTLATFGFNQNTNAATQNVVAQPANAVISPISYGSGLATKTVSNASTGTITLSTFEDDGVLTTSFNDYIEFTITPNSGYELHLDEITAFRVRRNGNGAQEMILYDNRSGSFAPASNPTTPLVNTNVNTRTFSLITPLVSTTAVTFRIYGYNRVSGTGPQQLIFDDINITGIVAIAAPTVQSGISISNITDNSFDITIANGDGAGQLILLQEGAPVDGVPEIYTYYAADALFGNADYITGPSEYANFAIYNDFLGSTTFTVTGLNPGTEYHAAIFDYNFEGSPGTENYLTTNPGVANATTLSPVYTWTGSISNDWTVADNWSPSRSAVTIFDELRFDGGGNVAVTNLQEGDLGKLLVTNSTHVSFESGSPIVLNLINNAGHDFVVEFGSTVEFGSANPIVLYLGTNTIADIYGTLLLRNPLSQIDGDGNLNIGGTFGFANTAGLIAASPEIPAINSTVPFIMVSGSTIAYIGAAQTITNTSYLNLTLAGSGNKTASAALEVSENLTIEGSAVLVPTTSVTVGYNWTSYGAAGFAEAGATVIFNGPANQSINTTGGEQFSNLTINKSGTLTLSSAVTVSSILTLTQGTVASGGNLTVNLNTGGVDGSGTGTITGNINLFKSISAPNNRTHYFSTPLSGQTVTTGLIDDTEVKNPSNNGSRLFYYDLPTKKFVIINDMNASLTPGTAYSLYFATGNLTLDYTGTYSHAASYTNPMGTTVGTYIIGNPYPSTIDWDAPSGWTKTNMNNAIYFWNASTNKYDSYINGAATGSASRYIAPFQAYMVSTNNASAAISSTNAVRTASIPKNILRTSSDILKIKLDNGTDFDETLIRFNADATSSFDGSFDAYKFYNNPGVPSLYTTSSDAKKLAINTYALDTDTLAIPLSLENAGENVQTMTFSGGTDIDGYELKLLDKVTGQKTSIISGGGYSFNRTETEPADRFTIFVERVGITTGTSTFTSKGINYYTFDKTLYINASKTLNLSQIELFDTFGNKVKTLSAGNATTYEFNLQDLSGGLYILKALSDGEMYTGKIVLK